MCNDNSIEGVGYGLKGMGQGSTICRETYFKTSLTIGTGNNFGNGSSIGSQGLVEGVLLSIVGLM